MSRRRHQSGVPNGLRLTADQFNRLIGIGTRVRFYPIDDELDRFENTTTRSEAWTLGHGVPVVKVEGRAGGVALDHLTLIEDA